MININTKKYWDNRFEQNWEKQNGRLQTQSFAESQMTLLELSSDFSGTILDFGCGLGDAMPVYKRSFPKAKLIGVDISSVGIKKCQEQYGDIADFICGSVEDIPFVDIIISSNVFEHLTSDEDIAKAIIQKTNKLYIIVPYQEMPLMIEHVNSYSEFSFSELNVSWFKIFHAPGWTESGYRLFKLYVRNLIRLLTGQDMKPRSRQIMFCLIKGEES